MVCRQGIRGLNVENSGGAQEIELPSCVPSHTIMVCIHNLQFMLNVVLKLIVIVWQQHKQSQGQLFDDIVAAL